MVDMNTGAVLSPIVSNETITGRTPALSETDSLDVSPVLAETRTPVLDAADELQLDVVEKPVTLEHPIPECWGHRGASATFPENTRASFIAAWKSGADGIETDVHITADNILVLFHDAVLGRTTTGSGRINDQKWYGALEHVRTIAQPIQPIPRFTEILDLLVLPENRKFKLNLDCKVNNDPVKLFTLLKEALEGYPGWQTILAPRIVLGIWHPKFLQPAFDILPFLPRYAITMSVLEADKYFFSHVHGFSVSYEELASARGAKFRARCAASGKGICCWTVNAREDMRNCVRWGVRSIITDKPSLWLEVRKEFEVDMKKALKPTLQTYLQPYLQKKNYWFDYERAAREEFEYLEREGGRFDSVVLADLTVKIATPASLF